MRFFLLLLVILICFCFYACVTTYGDNINRSYTPLKKDSLAYQNPSKQVSIIFNYEKVNFEYEKLGLIEVKGNQDSRTVDLLYHLKYEAWKNGADAVVDVKDFYITRETGVLFSKQPPTKYSAHVYNGIGVKINKGTDSLKFSQKNDTSFIEKAKLYDTTYGKKTNNSVIISFVLFILLTTVIIIGIVNK